MSKPSYKDAMISGLVAMRQSRFADARRALRAAVKRDRQNPELHGLLAGTELTLGDPVAALVAYAAALRLARDDETARRSARRMAYILATYAFPQDLRIDRRALIACLDIEGVDRQPVVMAATDIVKVTPPWRRFFEQYRGAGVEATVDALVGRQGRMALSDDLFQRCLRNGLICDAEFELVLRSLRRRLLVEDMPSPHCKAAAEGLATQCWIGEFAYLVEPDEAEVVERLAAEFRVAPGDAWTLTRLAMYRPLSDFSAAAGFYAADYPSLASLMTDAIDGVAAERRLRVEIKALDGGLDDDSSPVREQYEANPYPRWRDVSLAEDGERLATLRRVGWRRACPPRVLIAGCGTGRHVAQAALAYGGGARILAVDLSRASLAYAQRKATELGLNGLVFRQGDILRLGDLDETFDVIECVGVLHHLIDPLLGWRSLVGKLAPGGLMLVGIYRELGRIDCHAAREEIASLGLAPTLGDIRAYRDRVLRGADNEMYASLRRRRDFFSVSGCRDLLFHVQERNYRLPEITASLAELGLEFRGFQMPEFVMRQFRAQYEQPGAIFDLAVWNRFEQDNRACFDAMYRFWCRKR